MSDNIIQMDIAIQPTETLKKFQEQLRELYRINGPRHELVEGLEAILEELKKRGVEQ
jgi:hypothetical protein